MKKVFIFALAVMLSAVLGACGQSDNAPAGAGESDADASAAVTEEQPADDDLAYIQDKGTLVIGITDAKPMNYYENGELVGFDTEFAQAACAKLGLAYNFVIIDWDMKEVELNAKSIDCIWNGLTVTEERRKNMAFSDSYFRNEQVVVARAENAGKYTDAASLAGANVVAEAGSAGETAVAADMANAVYTAVSSQSGALLEVKAGTADAAVIDYTMARTMTGADTDYEDLTIIEGIDLADEEYAIGFRPGSTAVAAFNEIKAELTDDGTLADIAERYDISDNLIK
ncbi:MAG: transporter substrate-binding domain-containing protein [Clostridiales Family XIII bacterium]|jgi:polar amino acid transport system substrate-binding protein|nr:transporter substrate-binding domain-containing protein [Clostridiales Family XIII bacterium]